MKILVVGDIITDRYVYGTMERLNPEGPVPLVKVKKEHTVSGGAANVFRNLISLGVDADIIDYDERYQSVKTRILCDDHYITRVDDDKYVSGNYILDRVKQLNLAEYDYVILSDYAKGALDNAQEIIKLVGPNKVIVDPKRNVTSYKGAWLIKANELENEKFNIYENWDANYIITRAGGSVLAKIDDKTYSASPCATEIVDVTGAGDCFIAAFVYGLTQRYDYQKCINIATRAATNSIRHLGSYTLNIRDVEETIIFTNGCFDILHRGHIEYLEQSKRLGDKLIVGINSDNSVKRLKGENRPINSQLDRKHALEALRCVDEVIIFEEDTPSELIDHVQPAIITKGGDYESENVVGNDRAKIVILPYVDGFSTTKLIGKL